MSYEELKVLTEMLKQTHRPHMLCKDIRGDLFEFISYPWIEGHQVLVNVRVPGDPTSMITVLAWAMDPEDKPCLCQEAGKDYYLRPEYYREREVRLEKCPAFVRKSG